MTSGGRSHDKWFGAWNEKKEDDRWGYREISERDPLRHGSKLTRYTQRRTKAV